MKLAYVWYRPPERAIVEKLLRTERSSWHVDCIHESEVAHLEGAIRLLKHGYDGVMLHLSMPPCLALKLAELCHREKLETRILLLSRTDADPDAVSALFSGHINPDKNIATLTDRLEGFLSGPLNHLPTSQAIEEAIVRIMNTDDVFAHQFRERFPVLYRDPFSIDDYHKLAEVCLMQTGDTAPTRPRVFISYATRDESFILELSELFAAEGVSTFVAARDIESGNLWELDIRDAIRECAEMLVVLTPNSINQAWVMIEGGAAWVLGKRITPCLAFTKLEDVQGPLSRAQARSIVTQKDREKLVAEVSDRARGKANMEPVPNTRLHRMAGSAVRR